MGHLTAVFPVLFENHNYEPGDRLPVCDTGLAREWINNGTAIWEEDNVAEKHAVKARMVSAMPGTTGDAYPSAGKGLDLIGRPPSRETRGAQPEPSKKKGKSSA